MANMNDPIVKAIVEARVNLLLNHPFFGNLATRLQLVDGTDWCPTAATDGRRFYYNREFIKSLNKEELIFLVGHEILHVVYDHIGRRRNGYHDPKYWNMANDYIVNYTLVKEKIGEMIKSGLYSEKYSDEYTSEELYEILVENKTTVQLTIDMHLEAEGAEGESDDNNGSSDSSKSITATIDVQGTGNKKPVLSKEEIEEIRKEIKASIISAAQNCSGSIPKGIKRLVQSLTEPKIDWREMLETCIKSSLKDDWSYSKLSKRTWTSKIILPGQKNMDTVDIEIFLDTSGSVTDAMVKDFLSEVKGIMDMFAQFRLGLATFDTKVYNYQVFTQENSEDILSYEAKGRGGTLYESVFEYLKENEIEPNTLVMFTDGYPNHSWGDPNYCDTLFIIYGSENIVPPYGSYAYYTKPNKVYKK